MPAKLYNPNHSHIFLLLFAHACVGVTSLPTRSTPVKCNDIENATKTCFTSQYTHGFDRLQVLASPWSPSTSIRSATQPMGESHSQPPLKHRRECTNMGYHGRPCEPEPVPEPDRPGQIPDHRVPTSEVATSEQLSSSNIPQATPPPVPSKTQPASTSPAATSPALLGPSEDGTVGTPTTPDTSPSPISEQALAIPGTDQPSMPPTMIPTPAPAVPTVIGSSHNTPQASQRIGTTANVTALGRQPLTVSSASFFTPRTRVGSRSSASLFLVGTTATSPATISSSSNAGELQFSGAGSRLRGLDIARLLGCLTVCMMVGAIILA